MQKGPNGVGAVKDADDSLMPGQIPGKIYGQKAEYQYGVLGNYEPNIPSKSGPGMCYKFKIRVIINTCCQLPLVIAIVITNKC